MQTTTLQRKRALRTALLVLLLGVAGMGKGYAQEYDFSAVCETGQTLYYNIIGTNQVEMTSPTGMDWYGFEEPTGDIVLPESVQFEGTNYTVTSIGSYAFMYCRELTGSLAIPNSVTTIGFLAFSSCTGLTSLFIPQSVTSIGFDIYTNSTSSFPGCGFEQIIVDLNNPVYDSRDNCNAIIETSTNTLIQGCNNSFIPASVTIIGSGAFSGCIGLTSIDIPDSVTIIGSGAFSGCIGLTSIDIPDSITEIGSGAFSYCTGLTGDLVIPNSVTEIGEGAFENCTGLTGTLTLPNAISVIYDNVFYLCGFTGNLVIPNSVAVIGDEAFAGCTGFTGHLVIPNSVTEIGEAAFEGCTGFTSLSISQSVATIWALAFAGCTGLTGDLVIPNSVVGVGIAVFWDCSGLSSLTIGNSVEVLGSGCFYGCSGLTNVTSLATTPPYVGEDGAEDTFFGVPCTTLTVPCSCIPVYETSQWHDHFSTIIEDCSGVSEEEENLTASVYPNPTSGQMKIEAEGLKQITISNMLGQVIHEGKANGDVFQYDFGKHEAGVYLVRIETARGVITQKVTVTK